MARFDTLLIANRGEIACRVIRSARALGLRTVAVFSDADALALHVRSADAAVRIGSGPARDSYLDIDRIIDACRRSGAQAVHPGYGFLSENAAFARACRDAGIVFVGPTPEAIDALGNKSAAKRIARRIGVPCLPGYAGDGQDLDHLVEQAGAIGIPLMIKAAAGGGGRGMRRCDDVGDSQALRLLLASARAEALAAFGNGDLLLERRVDDARHVEIQVFGDTHGACIHLGERDCSTQRRNQKVLEEAPAPGVSVALRSQMGDSAVKLAREVGYVGAGTVEFLLGPDGAFWFLEMNTRLQVEHPVTEAITGLDLVAWQLRIAQGEPLPLAQDSVRWTGHSIEARLCAEDPFNGFVPQVGPIDAWSLPDGPGIRVDHGLAEAAAATPFYDSMIAKVVAHGVDREQARARLLRALTSTSVLGLRTNRDYLVSCLRASEFAAPALSTAWLERASREWCSPAPAPCWLAVAAALRLHRSSERHGPFSCWSSVGRRETPMRLEACGRTHFLRLAYGQDAAIDVVFEDGERLSVAVLREDSEAFDVSVDGIRRIVRASLKGNRGWLDADGVSEGFADLTDQPRDTSAGAADGIVTCRMHGLLAALAVTPGQCVARGDFLLSIEAMKMEHRFEAPVAGTVVEVGAAAGTQVSPGRLLVRIEPDPA
jgi:geranyl-CoA carboxylase alpha subunit